MVSDPMPGSTTARILLVEDNEADIKLVQILMLAKEKLHCGLTIARNGEQALQALYKSQYSPDHQVDLILLDINMPGMDGFDLLTKIKNDTWPAGHSRHHVQYIDG